MTEPPPAVAYLPGASGRSAIWRPVATRLASRRVPLLFDYPGLGDGAPDPTIRSLDGLASWVLDALPPRADIVSMSMGAALSLRIALAHPERVRKLVLVAASGGVDVMGVGGIDWRATFREQRPDAPTWFVDDRTDLTDRLHAITAPVLLVFGDQDLIAPVAVGEHLARHLPSATLEVIPGGTHDLEMDHADLVASLIEAHLRR